MSEKQKMNRHALAILMVVLDAFGFAMMAFFVRESGDLPTMQKVFFRNAVAGIIAAGTLLRKPSRFKLSKEGWFGVAMRSLFGTSGMILNFWAIDHIALADANILNKMSPFFAIIMSIFILKEVPNKFEVFMVAVAFIGAILIIQPSAGVASIPAFAGLLGGFGAGTAYTFVRKLGTIGVKGNVIVFYFSFFSMLVAIPSMVINYVPMSIRQWTCLILAGCAAALGQFCVTRAYQLAPAKEISVFDYTQVIFAGMLGFAFFGEVPNTLCAIGYCVVITAAVIKWYYNVHVQKN